jgi:hypothetical protein
MNAEYEKMRREFEHTGWERRHNYGQLEVEIWSLLNPGLWNRTFLYGQEAIDYCNRRSMWDNCEFDANGNVVE